MPSRRGFLRSSLLAGGAGWTLPQLCEARDASSNDGGPDTAVIQIWLGGGPSQFETFDPKPHAPVEFRGPYGAIQSVHPGVLACETMPRTAQVLKQAALIRTISHTTNGHFVGAHWLSCGVPGTQNKSSHPSSGAIVSKFRGPIKTGLPAYALLSEEQTRNLEIGSVMGSAYLGAQHAPFTIKQSPYDWKFQPPTIQTATESLKLADNMTIDRIDDRRALLAGLDKFKREADTTRSMEGVEKFAAQALDMVTSGSARRAFDMSQESDATRDLYGRNRWGQMGLLARRLVEAGVTFVTLNTAPDSLSWDWHRNIVNDNRPTDGSDGPSRGMEITGPPLDQMLSGLITDIYDRGLDKKVLLVVWGEFGRTPRVNKTGGRDHWGSLMSILLAGGGLKVGQVIGTSTDKGEVPKERPVHPTDVLATMYRHLGIDTNLHTINRAGRPIPILADGHVIDELI
jgi:hypothetical protein